MYVNNAQICKFQCLDNIHPYQFCLKSSSRNFKGDEMKEIARKGTVQLYVCIITV